MVDTSLSVFALRAYRFQREVSALKRNSGYWDFERGQLIVSAWNGALAFDLRTGQERAFMPGGSNLYIIESQNRLLTLSNHIGVYDLNTLTGVEVDTDFWEKFGENEVAVSPDGRYLIGKRLSYYVWDLTALPEALNDRDPIFEFIGPRLRLREMRFVDSIAVEITTRTGEVSRWNVETGEQIN